MPATEPDITPVDLVIELMEWPPFVEFCKGWGGIREALRSPIQTHHIWGGKTRKDFPSNLVKIPAAVHDFCHARPVHGRLAALWYRSHFPDFTWLELDASAGYNALEWVRGQSPFLPPPFDAFRIYLLEEVPHG